MAARERTGKGWLVVVQGSSRPTPRPAGRLRDFARARATQLPHGREMTTGSITPVLSPLGRARNHHLLVRHGCLQRRPRKDSPGKASEPATAARRSLLAAARTTWSPSARQAGSLRDRFDHSRDTGRRPGSACLALLALPGDNLKEDSFESGPPARLLQLAPPAASRACPTSPWLFASLALLPPSPSIPLPSPTYPPASSASKRPPDGRPHAPTFSAGRP